MIGVDEMILDCVVIGGGPAGLNASLILGRARQNIILFDDNQPRNAVTNKSHGFITRDGISPTEFREIAQKELRKYPNINIKKKRVKKAYKENSLFMIITEDGEIYRAKKVLLATGIKEDLPKIDKINEFYGISIFSCPFCDGWELQDRPLAIIVENNGKIDGSHILHFVKMIYNWSENLIVCTNGHQILSLEQKRLLKNKGIKTYEQKIASLIEKNGHLERIQFDDGTNIPCEGGFIGPEWKQSSSIGEELGCELNEHGAIKTDNFGRTNVDGIFACGDISLNGPSLSVIAAAAGSKAAIGVISELMDGKFSQN